MICGLQIHISDSFFTFKKPYIITSAHMHTLSLLHTEGVEIRKLQRAQENLLAYEELMYTFFGYM